MASVMPAATYPKIYVVNGITYTIKNAAEDSSFQASPIYKPGCTLQTYPKILYVGDREHRAKDSNEETSVRSKYGMS